MRPILVLAGVLSFAVGCAGGARSEQPAGGMVVAGAPSAPIAEDRTGEAAAVEALERGNALEKQGKRADAADVYQDALRRDDLPRERRAEIFIRMACVEFESGRVENALEYARGAQRLRPDWDDAAAVAARIEKKMHAKRDGDVAAAKKHKAKGDGSVEDRLARVEGQLARMTEKFEAFARRGAAPAATEKATAAELEAQHLREKIRRMQSEFDEQRVAMKKRLAAAVEEQEALRRQVAELKAECEALRAK